MSPDDGVEQFPGENEPPRQSDHRVPESGDGQVREGGDGRLPEGGDESTGSGHRVRRATSWIVLVVACILAITSVLVVFVRNEALDTDTYLATVQPLASDPAVQSAVADAVSALLVEGTNLNQQVAGVLPAAAGFLATPIAAGLENVVHQITLRFVQSDEFRALWTTINRGAHQQLVGLLTGSSIGPVSTARGEVKLDLAKVVDRVKRELDAKGISVFDRVGISRSPQYVLFKSTQLERLQGLIRTLDRLAFFLPIITLGLFAGGVLLNVDRRRGFVRAAIGLSIAMAGLLVVFAVGRHLYLGTLSGVTPHSAAAATYDIVTAVPLGAVRTILAIAVAAALVGVAMGNRSVRAWVRAWVRAGWPPRWKRGGQFHRLMSAYARPTELALFGIGMFVIVIWSNVAAGLPIVVAAGLIGLVDRHRSAPAPRAGAYPGGHGDGEGDGDGANIPPDETTKRETRW